VDVKVTQATLEVRTLKLTKALLKQFRKLSFNGIPENWTENNEFKKENCVGWFSGTVLGEEHSDFLLLTNNKGDYFVYNHVSNYSRKNFKQIYLA